MKTAGLVVALLCVGLVSATMAEPEIVDSQIDGYTVVLQGVGFGELGGPGPPGRPIPEGQIETAEAAESETIHSKVLLGENPDFDDCQQRIELAIKSWSDTEITVEIDPGDQPAGTMMYLFVIDVDGQANLAGRSFAIPADQEAPGIPGQPVVQ